MSEAPPSQQKKPRQKAKVQVLPAEAEEDVFALPSGEDADLDVMQDEADQYPEDYPDYFPSGIVEYLVQKDETNIQSKREDTRGRLALIYTVATFGIFVLGFIVSVIDAAIAGTSMIDNLTQLLPLISGIFLGTLGFVLGYYFRRGEEDEKSSTETN